MVERLLDARCLGMCVLWEVEGQDERLRAGVLDFHSAAIEGGLGDDNPLSPPCIPPKFVLHGRSARSKFLAANGYLQNAFTIHQAPFPSGNTFTMTKMTGDHYSKNAKTLELNRSWFSTNIKWLPPSLSGKISTSPFGI